MLDLLARCEHSTSIAADSLVALSASGGSGLGAVEVTEPSLRILVPLLVCNHHALRQDQASYGLRVAGYLALPNQTHESISPARVVRGPCSLAFDFGLSQRLPGSDLEAGSGAESLDLLIPRSHPPPSTFPLLPLLPASHRRNHLLACAERTPVCGVSPRHCAQSTILVQLAWTL